MLHVEDLLPAPTASWPCFASAAPGLEPYLAAELAEVGCEPHPTAGGVEFEVPLVALAALLRRLRCASRVLVRMAEGRVASPADVAALVDRVAWAVLPAHPARVALRLSAEHAPPDRIRWLQAELVRALLQRFGPGRVSTAAPVGDPDEVALVARLDDRVCQLSVDASGRPLHQRGWRLEAGPAPLRETLAAAMLRAAGYDGVAPLWDPMCGSGTIAIEAALWRGPEPRGLRPFALDGWRVPWLQPTLLPLPRTEAGIAALGLPRGAVVAGDVDAGVLELARRNAERAGVLDRIAFQHAELAAQQVPAGPRGYVVTNPPYGQRLGGRNAARRLYQRLGAVVARRCRGWRLAVLVPERDMVAWLPLAAPELVTVDNGGLPLWLVTGEIGQAGRVVTLTGGARRGRRSPEPRG